MNKLTTEEFIKRASERHNNFYDYSLTEYKNIKEKVTIICPIHGDFIQTPDKHLIGRGCTTCGRARNGEKLIINKEQYIEKAI